MLMLVCGGLIVGGIVVVGLSNRQMEHAMDKTMAGNTWNLGQYSASLADGDYAAAVNELDRLLTHDPNDPDLHHYKARLLATCPEDDIRNGPLAIAHAKRACDEIGLVNVLFVDTLAAAYAEAGDFGAAVQELQGAIDLTGGGPFWQSFEERLELYKSGQPYREDPLTMKPVGPHPVSSRSPESGADR